MNPSVKAELRDAIRRFVQANPRRTIFEISAAVLAEVPGVSPRSFRCVLDEMVTRGLLETTESTVLLYGMPAEPPGPTQ